MATSVEVPNHIDVDHQAGSYNEANTLSPMAQFADAPMALWQSVPIAPSLPSAENFVPPDFTDNFVQKCLHPSKTFLTAEGFEPEENESKDEAPKEEKVESEEKVTKIRIPKAPREPQPDYFGHLFGHPLSADEDDDEADDEEEGSEADKGKLVTKDGNVDAKDDDVAGDTGDVVAKASDVEEVHDEVRKDDCEKPKDEDVIVAKVVEAKEKPSIAASSPVERVSWADNSAKVEDAKKDDEPEESDDGDDDVDYFGHIMGHPMNRGSGSHKTKKQRPPAPKEDSPAKPFPKTEVESQESQGSVLGLFLGGIEVCDREENIGQFTSRGGDPVDTADIEAEVVEEEVAPVATDELKELEVSAAEGSKTPPATPVNAPGTPAADKDEIEANPVPERVDIRTEPPVESKQSPEKRTNEAIGSSSNAKEPAKKSRSFLGNLCGGKTMD